jgi:hypothetical protein
MFKDMGLPFVTDMACLAHDLTRPQSLNS